MDNLLIYKSIERMLPKYEADIYSATFIGSNYKGGKKLTYKNSDIDVLVILNNMNAYDDFVNQIKDVFKIEKNIEVINGWGVVSPCFLKKVVIHLLIDPIWHFKNRKFLFRNSVIKYPILIGKSLKDFCNDTEMSTLLKYLTNIHNYLLHHNTCLFFFLLSLSHRV